MQSLPSHDAVSFDCFGTLIAVDRPADPAVAVADALESNGIDVPADWEDAYAEPHRSLEPGREYSLVDHVGDALRSRSVPHVSTASVRTAVLEAFDSPVQTRDGALEAVAAAGANGPIGICSNCAVPGLVERALGRSALDTDRFDTIVTSVGCGWRKPYTQAFETIAEELDIATIDILHVGDDPDTDGSAPNAVLLAEHSLTDLATTWRRD